MKRYLLLITMLIGLVPLFAQEATVEAPAMNRNGNFLVIDLKLNFSSLEVKSNRAMLFTPCLVQGDDSLTLASVGVYGRNRYYHYVRNGESSLTGKEEQSFRASETPDTLPYQAVVPYEKWMNGASLHLQREVYGCCNEVLGTQTDVLIERWRGEPAVFRPAFAYVSPQVETEKLRSLQGQAFIDFPVNKTVIYPEYRRNVAELAKIQATIDSVKNDADIRITALSIKGYASPEGSYANNTRLAKGRTEALKEYVSNLYHFDRSFIATSFEPEDWEGLRRYVVSSELPHREEIAELIDSDLQPDRKEGKIKSAYPDEYRFLLQNCYPALRHSDYRIEYVIRSFSDAAEIQRIMHSQPQKLSLQEFYVLAQTLEPGSPAFNEVFETAVRMYPQDETANLNAANAAMTRNDLKSAARYLQKAGNSREAIYARGLYAAYVEDFDTARRLLAEAHQAGVKEATQAIELLEEYIKNK